MKAVVVPKVGGKWEVREVPTPEPSANQVLIKIHASGVCHTDASITEGKHPWATNFPAQ
jgi:propanol-preferring alcohol dehydrogenase